MSIAVALSVALVSCNKDNVNYEGSDEVKKDNIGYLVLSGMDAEVMIETENYNNEAGETRASEIDMSNFDVRILNRNGQTVYNFKYGNRPSYPLELEGGVYTLVITSSEMQDVAWEAPVYGAKKEFTIVRKQTTEVRDIVCKLQNIKVTVDYSADLKDQLDPDYANMVVALGESAIIFNFGEERGVYFAPLAETNTLDLTFTCRYKGETKDIVMTNRIEGVKAAQWRKINVIVQHAADGTSTIGVVCDTWTYDDEITFDTSSFLMEEVLVDDTDIPTINWEGYDLAETFVLTDAMFDAEGNFKSNINLDIVAKAPIKSIVVKVNSDNADFLAEYGAIMATEEDLCAPKTSAAILKMMGYPTDAKGATATRIKLAEQAELMKRFAGTHTYEITVVDDNEAKATATLAVKYGELVDNGPSLVWDGYNIDEVQTYIPGMTCDILVTSMTGLTDLSVKIISATLTPEELAGVGLAGEFSLVNDTQFFDSLKGLGFPVGDEVAGQTDLKLSITTFLSILNSFGAGDHNFEITATDAAGSITRTVMLHFE